MYQYAYLIGSLLLLGVWILLYLKRKDLRLEMVLMSIITIFWIFGAGVWFMEDVLTKLWKPESAFPPFLPFGLVPEDFIYTIAFAGIATVLYEEVLGKRHLKKRAQKHWLFLGVFPIILFSSFLVGIKFLDLNPYYACFIGFLISSLIIWLLRKDLILDSLYSGLFLSLVYFILGALIFLPLYPGIVESWWKMSRISGVLVLGLPLEEIFWAFTFGMFVGPSYEFLKGVREG